MELVEKAYELNLDKISEGFLYSKVISYGKTPGMAKKDILQKMQYEDLKLTNGEEVTFLNMPIRRLKSCDKYNINGKIKTLLVHEEETKAEERLTMLDKMLVDYKNGHAYIRKGSYYRPNSCGYTEFRIRAGVYTIEEAVSEAKSCDEITVVPINIKEHNELINKEIEELKSRIL
jgi:hypothetical protein